MRTPDQQMAELERLNDVARFMEDDTPSPFLKLNAAETETFLWMLKVAENEARREQQAAAKARDVDRQIRFIEHQHNIEVISAKTGARGLVWLRVQMHENGRSAALSEEQLAIATKNKTEHAAFSPRKIGNYIIDLDKNGLFFAWNLTSGEQKPGFTSPEQATQWAELH